MRALHREKLSRLFGNSARLSRSGFLNGLAAVLITSLLHRTRLLDRSFPKSRRGPIELGTWALYLLPILFFAFVQTSSEELLFRGYLQRGLAYRFRSPLVWAVLPTLVFTALHWNPASVLGMNIGVLISIGAFAALLALLVYATGNLGAAMGAHLGNNLVGFLLISHDDTLGGLALFRAPPLDGLAWTPAETATIAGISIVSILLTWLLLLHPRSPLKVEPDLGHPPGEPAAFQQEVRPEADQTLTLPGFSCLCPANSATSRHSEQADRDALSRLKSIPEANTRQRDAPPGAFWLWALLGRLERTHYLSGSTA